MGWAGTDKVSKKLYAPADGRILKVYKDGNNSFFNFGTANWFIQFVHDVPIREGEFKRGEYLGDSTWDHHHVAINVDGQWHWIQDYLDRGIDLSFWTYGARDNKWAKWSSYPTDLQLPGDPVQDPCEAVKKENEQLKAQVAALQNKISLALFDAQKVVTDLS